MIINDLQLCNTLHTNEIRLVCTILFTYKLRARPTSSGGLALSTCCVQGVFGELRGESRESRQSGGRTVGVPSARVSKSCADRCPSSSVP